jgi:hypothetical protein
MKLPAFNRSERCDGERGFALLLVVVVVVLLGLIVGGLWEASQPVWEDNSLDRARFQAGLLAESGLSVAMHPRARPGDLALRHQFDPARGYEVLVTGEGGRFPVNLITEAAWREIAVELFILWGLDAAAASQAADGLADWIDADDNRLPNGAERPHYAQLGYPEFPANAPFTSLEQMLYVSGMEAVARRQPMWRDYFTLYSDDLIDLNGAPWELVAAATGATRESALNFVAVRQGDDGIAGTNDDYRFEDVGEARAILGLAEREWNEIAARVTLSGSVRRIVSVGRVGDFEERRVVLARQTETDGNVVYTVIARLRE